MGRSGTLVICVQNLDFSGANQVILNIVQGLCIGNNFAEAQSSSKLQRNKYYSNVIILSPTIGKFAARFVECGVSVRSGDILQLLSHIRDIYCVICNTVMTANIVVDLTTTEEFRKKTHTPNSTPDDSTAFENMTGSLSRSHMPVIWILHEWWTDEMIISNLRIRNIDSLTLSTVKMALRTATKVVFVSKSQQELYHPEAPSEVIYVGVPEPSLHTYPSILPEDTFTILVLGIVCPRKNQLWAIEIFKTFKKTLRKEFQKNNTIIENQRKIKLVIVGARFTREYEIAYVEKVKTAIKDDNDIELYEVTDAVDDFYSKADCLLVTSINEVTPMVIPEAMSRSIPVLSTNIAGIPELFNNNEGFLFRPYDTLAVVNSLRQLYYNKQLCSELGSKGRLKYETSFTLQAMVENYKKIIFEVAPIVILVDMDGVLVNWDEGFYKEWEMEFALRGENVNKNIISSIDPLQLINRSLSYYMEECVSSSYKHIVTYIHHMKSFYLTLDPKENAVKSINEMKQLGFDVFICTTPVLSSCYCMNEKVEWIRNHLGDSWVNKIILCVDKTIVKGDILIDDKPLDYLFPNGTQRFASWKQVVFDAPYNQTVSNPRLKTWNEWKDVIFSMISTPILPSIASDYVNRILVNTSKELGRIHDVDLNEESKSNIPIPGVNLWESERMKQAQEMLDCLLGPFDDIISPEDACSIAGSASLLEDTNDDASNISQHDNKLTHESLGNIEKKIDKIKKHKKSLQETLKLEVLASLGDMQDGNINPIKNDNSYEPTVTNNNKAVANSEKCKSVNDFIRESYMNWRKKNIEAQLSNYQSS